MAVSPNRGRNIAVMAVSEEGKTETEEQTKLEMSVAISLDAIEALDDDIVGCNDSYREECLSPIPMSPPDQFRSITPTMPS